MKCVNCNTETDNPKFCSRRCSVQVNNRLKPKRKKAEHKANCLFCKKEFEYQPSSTKGMFCSNQCSGSYQYYTISVPAIERGEGGNLRRYLKETRGYFCEICNNDGTHCGKPLTLQLDHKDGNSDNNLPDNLRFLCPNCHTQTDTWCARNIKGHKRNRYLRKYKGYERD